MDKMQWIHIIEYYSAIKRNEVLPHGWTLKTLCWVKEGRYKRPHILWFSSCDMFRIGKFLETESKLMVDGGWRGGTGVTDKGYRVSFEVTKMLWN